MSDKSHISESEKAQVTGKTKDNDQIQHASEIVVREQVLDLSEMTENNNLTFDWEKTLQMSKAFKIPDSEDKNSLTDQQLAEERYKQFEAEFLVPEPSSLSRITDSTIKSSSSRTTTDIEEKYVDNDMSSLSQVSDINVSNAPRKHEFAKERSVRAGNTYDKLYNASLKGQLRVVKEILKNHNTTLMPDENGQTALYAASIGGHTEIISILLKCGYDVNHQDNEGKTVLHIAFENHAPDLAQTLITHFSASIEMRDMNNWTPLHTAIDRGYYSYSHELSEKFLHQDIGTKVSCFQLHVACFQENIHDVKFLLNSNTDVNHVSSAGYTPLHIVVDKSNIDLVSLLLDHKADVNSMTSDHNTPLHIAVYKGDETIIQELLTRGADPSLKDVPGNTSLHLAVQMKETRPELFNAGTTVCSTERSTLPASYHSCSIHTVQAIKDHVADVNAINNRGQSPLWLASCDGQDGLVKILLDTGADPSITDKYRDSCLHAAIHGQCSTETILEILDHGAHVNINMVNKDGATPLLLACGTAQAEAVKLLLKAKADPNISYADGDASLHAAIAADCNEEIIQEIIDYGAGVNAVNNRGRTALLLGCFYRQMDSVRVLLGAGADPTIADKEGFSCLHAAIDLYCSIDILQELIDHGAHTYARRKDGTNALLRACRTGQSESVRFLLEAGADVSITKPNDNTCLHVAVQGNCCKGTLQQIIERGVNVNIVNKMGKTALILACESAQSESVNLLLEKAADPNICDAISYTALHAAVHGCCTNETLQEIINHKAHLDAQNIHGQTALWLACSYRQQDSVRILLAAGTNTNIADNFGNTSLHSAVFGNCSKKMIRAIINHGADVNATNKFNETALIISCTKQNIDAIKVLLKAGAGTNIANADGNTCLHAAVDGDCSKEVLETIIKHDVDVKATNKRNVSALMIACRRGNKDAINILLNTGADPNIARYLGDTCLHDAVRGNCSKEILQTIISHGADVNATNTINETALIISCRMGNIDAINVLLNAGAETLISTIDGETCLHAAADGDCSKDVLEIIISQCVDVNATNQRNASALMIACKRGDIDAINLLLNTGADPNIARDLGDTCLHDAVRGDCSKEVLQTIISHGADVNATNTINETALIISCRTGNIDAINVFLNAGAETLISTIDGDTCLHAAANGDCSKDVLEIIISHGVDVNATNQRNASALMIACKRGDIDAIDLLLNTGADLNIARDLGDTCLHDAVRGDCSKEILQTIMRHGVDVNATNSNNATALMMAVQKGNVEAIHELLHAGANTNIADEYGNTCLHDAVLEYIRKDVLQTIIYHGAHVNAKNNRNETPLMIALWIPNKDAINVLLNAGADPNIATKYGNTCLHNAVGKGYNKEALQAIISYGADVNATNKNNATALMIACRNGNVDAINVLINAGAGANGDDYTCLHCTLNGVFSKDVHKAIINQDSDVKANRKINSSTIINHSAGVNAVNKNNVKALMTACANGDEVVVHVLLNAGANPNIMDYAGDTCLHYTVCGESSIHRPDEYIDHCSVVNGKHIKDQSALILVCATGNAYAVSVLLNSMTGPKLPDTGGDTQHCNQIHNLINKEFLHVVIDLGAEIEVYVAKDETIAAPLRTSSPGHRESTNLLLRAGADTTISNVFGDTCLHQILQREYLSLEYDHETLQMLLDHGTPVNATNKNNQTAYMLASHQGNIDAMCALLNAGADPSIISTDDDASLPYTDDGCSSSVCLQTILHWLNPAWHYLDLPSLEIVDSMAFNLVPRIIYSMMRHGVRSKRSRVLHTCSKKM